jgi:hypothetical protein
LGIVVRRFVASGKGENLPKGIIVSPDELAAHVDDLRSRGLIDSAKQAKLPMGDSCGYRQVEVSFNDQKCSMNVFDGSSEEDNFVVIELRGCVKGPPLLPPQSSENDRWSVPEDYYIHLAAYLVRLMWFLHQGDWSDRISADLNGRTLLRYQAVVKANAWRKLWDALLKPLEVMRAAYRGVYKCRKAPDLFFGVDPRYYTGTNATSSSYSGEKSSENRREREIDVDETADELSQIVQGNVGIPCLSAAEWLEYWSHQEIPQRRTFIDLSDDFASNTAQMTSTGQMTRSTSLPDLFRTTDSNDAD